MFNKNKFNNLKEVKKEKPIGSARKLFNENFDLRNRKALALFFIILLLVYIIAVLFTQSTKTPDKAPTYSNVTVSSKNFTSQADIPSNYSATDGLNYVAGDNKVFYQSISSADKNLIINFDVTPIAITGVKNTGSSNYSYPDQSLYPAMTYIRDLASKKLYRVDGNTLLKKAQIDSTGFYLNSDGYVIVNIYSENADKDFPYISKISTDKNADVQITALIRYNLSDAEFTNKINLLDQILRSLVI